VLIGVLLAVPATAHADVRVYFLQGEQVVGTTRPGTTAEDALRALLAGPTPAETARGYRTYVPADTGLRSIAVSGSLATVDLTLSFLADQAAESQRARISQLVYTLNGTQGVRRVKLLLEGGTPVGLVPGIVTERALSVRSLRTPDVRPPSTAEPSTGATPAPQRTSVRAAQERLADLGYLLPGDVDGRLGPATTAAVIAFQKWEGLGRDGVIGPATTARLRTASRPTPSTRGGSGRRAEVLLGKQVALAIEDNRVVRTIHVSTGAEATPTPPGSFKVYGQFARWWSTPFQEWLLWASAFNGGIAFHQFPDVPVFPASHGCVRITVAQARWMYDFLDVGTPVRVIG
jgi:lipoprotein-anchoring transpeptidase ErfK/SrfK